MLQVIIKNSVTQSLNVMINKLKLIHAEAFKEFVKATPKRTGRARNSTRLSGNTIVADYPYAKQLDDGSSPKAPDGMTKPTEDFINKRVSQIVKGN